MHATPLGPQERRTRNALAVFGGVEVVFATGLALLLAGVSLPGLVQATLGGALAAPASELALGAAVLVFGGILALLSWDFVAGSPHGPPATPPVLARQSSWQPAAHPSHSWARSLHGPAPPTPGRGPTAVRPSVRPISVARVHRASLPAFRGVRR